MAPDVIASGSSTSSFLNYTLRFIPLLQLRVKLKAIVTPNRNTDNFCCVLTKQTKDYWVNFESIYNLEFGNCKFPNSTYSNRSITYPGKLNGVSLPDSTSVLVLLSVNIFIPNKSILQEQELKSHQAQSPTVVTNHTVPAWFIKFHSSRTPLNNTPQTLPKSSWLM